MVREAGRCWENLENREIKIQKQIKNGDYQNMLIMVNDLQ